eukprot:Plantae.Rhodophyta-Purpureofilum_apyrenoidigerum.ctg10676.p1 GENE.Plantae.Rhodophyta-Purpureofilum_apyrenoidigerum.ctg10676~~Plantae.Rhodophyta-Purpureofilum_apyrenoidigerum.ctg10676.p1  ORF type:complete len:134 (-),score=19.76 Plantae.Rhodophyta-Purpureofilum_apyrenoidigerum.ctg10676:313-714(-)
MRRMSVSRVTASELALLLRTEPRQVTIIDVRDSDFEGGNLAGAHNIPRDRFKYTVDEQVKRFKDKQHVVFHCMLSQVRGPYCAQLFQKKLDEHGISPQPKVSILEGGFSTFAGQFYKDKELFENMNVSWGPMP